MRIAFAGTPPFAAITLEALIQAGHEVVLVYSQPDRPSGRGMKLKPSAVKEVAIQHNIPTLTPETLSVKKDPEGAELALRALENAQVDVLIVAAYGLILPQRMLDAAKGIGMDGSIKSMNIHGSLLPRWRGAAPIQRAIAAGDAETGITLMKMEAGLDTGPMICMERLPISDVDTTTSITESLAQLGARMTLTALEKADSLTYVTQPESGVTYAEKILKSESTIDWTMSAKDIDRRIRAFNPFPFCNTSFNGEIIKIRQAHVTDGSGIPGTVLANSNELVIACGQNALACTILQRAGKPALPANRFLQSLSIPVGAQLQ